MRTAMHLYRYAVCVLVASMAMAASTQQIPATASSQNKTPAIADNPSQKVPTSSDRKRAAKLFLEASKLYENQQFEAALQIYDQAQQLDSTNADYRLAAEIARSHAVTALFQTAAKDRTLGDLAGARVTLAHALEIDPGNRGAAERLQQLSNDSEGGDVADSSLPQTPALGRLEQLEPTAGTRSFHVRSNPRQIILEVFHSWGIEATVDDSIRGNLVRFDVDDVTFAQAVHALSLLTDSFNVPIDAHRVLVARDTREMRQQFMRNGVETLPLSGLTATEMTDFSNMARNVFEIQQASVDPSAATMTLRAPEATLNAFNATYRDLMEGRSEVLIDVRLYQLAHNNARNTGLQPTQTITAFNVYSEAQSILNQNQDLVNQIIASGLAKAGDWQTILGLLIASGQVSSALFQNGIVTFGGGLTLTGLSPGTTTVNLNLNSSDSRELDEYRLRLLDGEEGTLKSGTRYPIMTSSYSSLSSNSLNIPGLSGAGNSSSLLGLLSQYAGASTSLPQFQYQDLGLVLKARPRVLRSGEVAMTIDLTIRALTGAALNNVPVLANRSFSGAVTVRADQSVLIASEVDKSESRAISGFPGLSEIPGLSDVTDKNTQKNYATLVMILTPRVVRIPHGLGHSPMVPVVKTAQAQ